MKHTPETFELSQQELSEAVEDFLRNKKGVSKEYSLKFIFTFQGLERRLIRGSTSENWEEDYLITAKATVRE